jgi:DNA-binding MarR family transcriptional regulator
MAIVRKPNYPDGNKDETLRALVEVPALARRLFPREQSLDAPGDQEERPGMGTTEARLSTVGANALQVLALLALEPEADVARIVDALALHKATVSGAVRELRDRGLLEDESIVGDRRRRRYSVTAVGDEVISALATRARDVLDSTPPSERFQAR